MTEDGVQVVAHPDTGKPGSVLIVEDKTLIASFIDAVLGISDFRAAGITGSAPEGSVPRQRDPPGSGAYRYRAERPPDGAALACLLRQAGDTGDLPVRDYYDRDILRRANAARPLGFIRAPFAPSQGSMPSNEA
jgi:hypothetical protein